MCALALRGTVPLVAFFLADTSNVEIPLLGKRCSYDRVL